MRKALFTFSFLLMLPVVGSCYADGKYDDYEQSQQETVGTRRHTLYVQNDTHRDEDGPGRDLHLVWERDVDDPPRHTERLKPGHSDWFRSRGIGRGHNWRHFDVTVYRWKNGKKLKIGKFTHSFYAAPGAKGHEETSTLFKNYTHNKVEVWREWFDHQTEQMEQQRIGSVPRDDW